MAASTVSDDVVNLRLFSKEKGRGRTLLVRSAADLGDTAVNVLDERFVGAEALEVRGAACSDQAEERASRAVGLE